MSAKAPGRGQRVLVTRAPPQARKTAEGLTRLGFEPVLASLLSIDLVTPPPPVTGNFQAILITSANAVPALSHLPIDRATPVLCVGDATREAVQAAGFESATSAHGDGRALARLALKRLTPKGGTLLHLHGQTLAHDPLAALSEAGFHTRSALVYRARHLDEFSEADRLALRTTPPRFALAYSPESARSLAAALNAISLQGIDIIAISEAAAEPLRSPERTVIVGDSPSEDAMLKTLINLAEKQDCGPRRQGL